MLKRYLDICTYIHVGKTKEVFLQHHQRVVLETFLEYYCGNVGGKRVLSALFTQVVQNHCMSYRT